MIYRGVFIKKRKKEKVVCLNTNYHVYLTEPPEQLLFNINKEVNMIN